ncbi:cryptochrome-1 [Thrips palmi]|uniref:Cryptochrome-1 n=1 Tax=Thrips palmi TaxID=161013 RepID=A0A6P8Z873_THRPL|nr:cryptochrome-1 [Thrips palmi]XP_034243122.1 cryptochrome-1 [Thrips palmi]
MALIEEISPKGSVLWFRRGLRLHDNPALLKALSVKQEFYPIFIFDGLSAGVTKDTSYNRVRFLLECLQDLDEQLQQRMGKLYFIRGDPKNVFEAIHKIKPLESVSFELDPEPIWASRDNKVKTCLENCGIKWTEEISHTLWDPHEIIETNGGIPPLTYEMFLHTVSIIGAPPRPVDDPDWTGVQFGKLPQHLGDDIEVFQSIPSPEKLGYFPPKVFSEKIIEWTGGEQKALLKMNERLKVEENAFLNGFYLPNQAKPDILGPPTSQSAALCFGCLSVRKFYWAIHDMYSRIYSGHSQSNQHITGQLIWREFFYTMCVQNQYYGEMERNPICLNISWKEDVQDEIQKWENGQTGYPFIDAVMRQMHQEGWVHHVARNAVACFLTRGDLWMNWEIGLRLFLRLLLDADWCLCAGNWMWVSSSAFEQLLDCSSCVCPVSYGRRLDPQGEYIRRYIPELRNFPQEYLYEPWKAPLDVQERAGCFIGREYPDRMVDHADASQKNRRMMRDLRLSLVDDTPHCCPSNVEEVRQFMWLPESCTDHLCETEKV